MRKYTTPYTPWQFPEGVHRVLNAAAQKGRVDIAMGIAPFMATLSTLVQAKFTVGIKNSAGAGLVSSLSTFWVCVAESSEGKGPVYDTIMTPVNAWVAYRNKCEAQENKTSKSRNESLNVLIKAKRLALKRCPSERLDEAMDEIASLEEQKVPLRSNFVFSTQDTTTAGLMALLEGQEGNRVGILDEEGRGARSIIEDRRLAPFLNQAYDGRSVGTTRATSHSFHGLKPHVSLGLVLQPDKLSKLATYPELWGEGFFPRVMPIFPASYAGMRPPLGATSDPGALSLYAERIAYLFE